MLFLACALLLGGCAWLTVSCGAAQPQSDGVAVSVLSRYAADADIDVEDVALARLRGDEKYLPDTLDPELTNYRFAVLSEGKLTATNDSDYETAQKRAERTRTVNLLLSSEDYTKQAVYEDPVANMEDLLYGERGVFLDDPDDFRNWYFTDSQIDGVYHSGLDVTRPEQQTEEITFDSVEEAKNYDYEETYGEGCEWTVYDNATASVTYYASGRTYADHVPLEEYYQLKRLGEPVKAQNAALEEKLTKNVAVTVTGERAQMKTCDVVEYLAEGLPVRDGIRSDIEVLQTLTAHPALEAGGLFFCALLCVFCCVLMCCAAGYSADGGEAKAVFPHTAGYEMFWLLPLLVTGGAALTLWALREAKVPALLFAVFCAGLSVPVAGSFVLWLYTTAVRVKTGTFWQSFAFVRAGKWLSGLFSHRPFTCIAAVLWLAGLAFANAFALRNGFTLAIALVLDALTALGTVYIIYCYCELRAHVKAIEAGDLSAPRRRIKLRGQFAKFDQSLDHITRSVDEMVARQTKAERMRAELITNVSHDLKTPLTSVINYVDLLSREPAQTPKAAEYLEVLGRASQRLKKLTIDLVDASKASTGNVEVRIEPVDLSVMTEQLAGEYADRFAEKGLTLLTRVADGELFIAADGGLLGRVADNLLQNALKYAMPGTRVYLNVFRAEEEIRMELKNISAYPLEADKADELTERFVRGDASRHTEGSGLGLSIAKDLTALQGGRLELQADGDLFKAAVVFPALTELPAPAEGEGI